MDNSTTGSNTADSLRHHPGPAPALIFLHGWCCDGADWEQQIAHFKGRHEILAPDLPGHGQTPAGHPEADNIPQLAKQALAVLAAAKSHKAVLIGHSMGGPVALEMAARQTDRVAAVVLVDSFLIDYGGMSKSTIERLGTAFDGDFSKAMENMVERSCGARASATLKKAILDKMRSMDADRARRLWKAMVQWDPRSAFHHGQAPIHAINSPLVADSTRQRLASLMSETIIPDSGHFIHRECPELFNQALSDALHQVM
ncbi:pimeloyl-ACP methyl ester carboxylesterase [Natronospira proteinivora]|uniref:Pimeloyl-ACP methyl ester carboxylesterase n=1 Tax=Natronospira proteinivora TaxID=1807133 RepID=A0ABT1G6D5_9GAMM|nr:alpha/beta hydrolase [Natronospira proteinivora]MCP1726505.1 pimeloyl-ACP methyl ester carboxylesterase [Natronospira proteinivora]